MPQLDSDRWRVVSPLLDQALDLAPGERAAWLRALRAEDAALAADVEALLARHAVLSREDFLASAPAPPPAASLAGVTLGPYTLQSLIGQGGMGSVWLAERNDDRFEGFAAVKLLNANRMGPDGEARFKREGSLLARLSHPNIAHLLDAGVSPLGQPYLVLEHVDGERIDRFCDARNLDIEARCRLFLDVLAAVAFAHANLIVHRDLKPANVLVGKDGRVKLLDFGIAKLLEQEAQAGELTITREGETALTPEYAAPEQLTGGPIATTTDVYALGVLLFVLLTGRHPVGANTTSPAEWIKAVVEGETPLPSAAALTAHLSRLLRGDLDNIVAKALKKAPPERYPSVEALADDLRRHLDQQPVSARPDSLGYRLSKFIRRNRVAVVAGTLTAAGLVTTTAVSLEQMREARRQRDQAVYEKNRADTTSEFQDLLMSSVGNQPVTMREIVDQGKVLLETEYAGEPEVGASLALLLAGRYAEFGEYELQIEMLDRTDSLAALGGAKDVALNSPLPSRSQPPAP